MKKYPKYIYEYVRQNLGLEKDDKSKDKEINKMPKFEVFNRCCTWKGLIGWAEYTFISWIKDIYDFNIDDRNK